MSGREQLNEMKKFLQIAENFIDEPVIEGDPLDAQNFGTKDEWAEEYAMRDTGTYYAGDCKTCAGTGSDNGTECDDCYGTGEMEEVEEGPGSNDNWGVGDYVVPNWEGANEHNEPLKVTGVHGDQVRVVDDYGNSELMSPNDLKLAPSNELSEGDPEDTEWDAHWAREDGDDERADDLEADAEWARMDNEVDESYQSALITEDNVCGVCKKEFASVGHPDEDMCPSCTKEYLDEVGAVKYDDYGVVESKNKECDKCYGLGRKPSGDGDCPECGGTGECPKLDEGEGEELPPIHAIARDIIKNWKRVYFGAVPYLDAMQSLSTKHDDYGADSGSSILAYGLGNMNSYSGRSVHDPELAKKHRAQLKQHLKEGIDLESVVESVLEAFPGQPKDYEVDPYDEADQREMADDMDDDFEKDYIDPEIEDEELGLRFD